MGGCCGQERKPMFENGNTAGGKNADKFGSIRKGPAAGNSDKYVSKSANKYKSYVSRSNLSKFDTKKFQTNNNNTLKEAADLNKALEKEDVIKIVHYFENNTQLIDTYEFAGTWAPSPETVGSLACGYLASFFMNPNEFENEELTEEDMQREEKKKKLTQILVKTELCSAMKRNLKHQKNDRVELTVLLTRILVEENEEMQIYFVKNDFVLDLAPFLAKKNNRKPVQIAAMETIDFLISFREKESEKFLTSEGYRNLSEFLVDKDNTFEEVRLGLQLIDSLCTREEAKDGNEDDFKNKNTKILGKFKEQNLLQVLNQIKENTSYLTSEELINDEDRKFCENYVKFLTKKLNENT